MRSLYIELGVEENSTAAAIKAAFRILAMKHHPDRGGDHDKMQKIQNAYDILSDPERRALYDETGDMGRPPSQESRALEMLGAVVNALISNAGGTIDLDYVDPLQAARDSLHSDLKEGERQQKKLANLITEAKKAQKRFVFRGKSTNYIELLLQGQIDSKLESMAKVEAVIEDIKYALTILADYDYTVASRPSMTKEEFEDDLDDLLNKFILKRRAM